MVYIKMKTIKSLFVVVFFLMGTIVINAQDKVDLAKSTVKWTGEKIGGSHHGFIKLKSAVLEVKDNKIESGKFVMDMKTITNEDIENEDYRKKLIEHLNSEDFFGVEKYPESMLVVTRSTKFTDGKATVTGNLTIKGKTEEVSFDVMKSNNAYTATIKVDRSKYDVRYGSKSFFNDLGDKAIDDIFTLDVKIVL